MTRLVILLLVGLLFLVGCGTPDEADKRTPTEDSVIADIEQKTDCAELQADFDRQMADVERREPGSEIREIVLGYATAADERMDDLGCYDSAYTSCDDAREAGVTPIHRGDPGYSTRLDRDGDGIACE